MSHSEGDPDGNHPDENGRWERVRRWLKVNGHIVWQEACLGLGTLAAIYEALRPGQ